jgi:hypothetical protein
MSSQPPGAASSLPPRSARRAAAGAAAGPVPSAVPSAGPTFPSVGEFARTYLLEIPRARALAGGARAPAGGPAAFQTRASLAAAIPKTTLVQSVQLMGGVFAGAAITALLISKLFPNGRVLTALGVGAGGSLLAASSPPASLAESLGLGAAVGSGLWLLLDMVGQIKSPPTTTTTGQVLAPQPPDGRRPPQVPATYGLLARAAALG